MTSTLAKEIERRMTALNQNRKSLSQKAGLNETAVRDIVEGRSQNPRHDTVAKIAKALGCTVADLLGEHQPQRRKMREATDTVSINELDVHVAAGAGMSDGGDVVAAHESASVVGVHTMPASSYREAHGVPPSRIRIIPVRGTSMEPELWAGQRVMVDIEDKIPSPPGIFVVWDGLGLVLKYVEVVANSEPVRVRISSAHKAFQPYERNLDEAHINGRVIGVWKRM